MWHAIHIDNEATDGGLFRLGRSSVRLDFPRALTKSSFQFCARYNVTFWAAATEHACRCRVTNWKIGISFVSCEATRLRGQRQLLDRLKSVLRRLDFDHGLCGVSAHGSCSAHGRMAWHRRIYVQLAPYSLHNFAQQRGTGKGLDALRPLAR